MLGSGFSRWPGEVPRGPAEENHLPEAAAAGAARSAARRDGKVSSITGSASTSRSFTVIPGPARRCASGVRHQLTGTTRRSNAAAATPYRPIVLIENLTTLKQYYGVSAKMGLPGIVPRVPSRADSDLAAHLFSYVKSEPGARYEGIQAGTIVRRAVELLQPEVLMSTDSSEMAVVNSLRREMSKPIETQLARRQRCS